jgi:hypothetical protein
MDHQFVAESIARQLAGVWAIRRTPAFVDYLLQTFGCEPLQPIGFAGIFSLQMVGGYFYPDLPPAAPVVERLWLMDDTGFRPSNMDELRSAENLESDNPLVVYGPSRASYKLINSQPWLLVYPRFKFCVRDDIVTYYEQFGFHAGCSKTGKLVINDRVSIQDACVTKTTWQGHYTDLGCTGHQR